MTFIASHENYHHNVVTSHVRNCVNCQSKCNLISVKCIHVIVMIFCALSTLPHVTCSKVSESSRHRHHRSHQNHHLSNQLSTAAASANSLDYHHLSESVYNSTVTTLDIRGNPVYQVTHNSFSHLSRLKALTLSDVKKVTLFPNLNGTSQLEHLRIDRNDFISKIPDTICHWTPKLKSLIVKSTKITAIPQLTRCHELRLIDLSYNKITTPIDDNDVNYFTSQSLLIDLVLSHNLLSRINKNTFQGLQSLQVLDLEGNLINYIHPEAFVHLVGLRDLNLAGNSFHVLPTLGLQNLRQIKTYDNSYLKDFPGPEYFPKIQTLALSYSYHCCQYESIVRVKRIPIDNPNDSDTIAKSKVQEMILWLEGDDIDVNSWTPNNSLWQQINLTSKFDDYSNQLWKTWSKDYVIPDSSIPNYSDEYYDENKVTPTSVTGDMSYTVQCFPLPSPFMPCEDLFGWWTLRCGIWIVFLLALLGNSIVVAVLLFGRTRIDVPRFLVTNLAFADFFMGIYLGSLAIVDASTLGEFKKYAVSWQTSFICQLTGFFGVLSSELSVFTLAVITLERNYAITNAMHLNKRLSLKHASAIMTFGWIFAIVMAALPFFGISDYRKFAVCLPFEIENGRWSMAYVVTLIVINGCAFLILMGCYLRMYCAIKGSQTWNSNDSRIAKRMALLVFTDFICWAPIAFFSLTAISGYSLISLNEAKIFTIFVLPLNSCCNPFLYAIFTKQFKKDCAVLCKRFEESRVTRGIGMGRNSSNFSNRQTPVNTNSAADKRSNSGLSGTDVIVNQVCRCTNGGTGTAGHGAGGGTSSRTGLTGALRGDTTISIELKLPESSVSTVPSVKERKKKPFTLTSKWLWLQRRSRKNTPLAFKSASVKSNTLNSTGSSLPNFVTSSISSDNCLSSPSESILQVTIPMKSIPNTNHHLKHSLHRNSYINSRKLSHDSTLTNSTFRTTSTTRSSVSSSSSASKMTDSTTVRSSYSHHRQVDTVNSLSSTDNDSSSVFNRHKRFTSGKVSGDSLADDNSRLICKTCSFPRDPSSSPIANDTNTDEMHGSNAYKSSDNRRDLEERVNYFFKKLAEASHDDTGDEFVSSSKDDSNIIVSASSRATDDSFTNELNDSSFDGRNQPSTSTGSDYKNTTPEIVIPEAESTADCHSECNDSNEMICNNCTDDIYLNVDRYDSSRSPSTLSIKTTIPANCQSPSGETSSLLNINDSYDNNAKLSQDNPRDKLSINNRSKLHDRCQSLLTIEANIKKYDRKVSSDNSIKHSNSNECSNGSSTSKFIHYPNLLFNSITSHLRLFKSTTSTTSAATSSTGTRNSKSNCNVSMNETVDSSDAGTTPLLDKDNCKCSTDVTNEHADN